MQKKLISSIYIDPERGQAQTAHALTANITTRQGFDLNIVALSQKKPGGYAPIDTPRKTLLSFVTSLQNGTGSSIEQIIYKAINAVTVSTSTYTRRRGGAPCGLTAGIMYKDQLFSLQVGAGEIIYHHKKGLHLLTHSAGKKAARQVWLGEVKDLTVQQINLQKITLSDESTIIVCKPEFVREIASKGNAFKQAVAQFSTDPNDLARDIANWATQNGIEKQLTMAVQHWPSEELNVISDPLETLIPAPAEEPEAVPAESAARAQTPATEVEPAATSPEPTAGIEPNNQTIQTESTEHAQPALMGDQPAPITAEIEDDKVMAEQQSEFVEHSVKPVVEMPPAADQADVANSESEPISTGQVQAPHTEASANVGQDAEIVQANMAPVTTEEPIDEAAEDQEVFEGSTRQEVREQIDAMDFTDLFEDPPTVDLFPSGDEDELDEQPKVVLPKNVLEVDLIDEDSVGLTDEDFGELELEEDDTQRMDAVEASTPIAPVHVNGMNGKSPQAVGGASGTPSIVAEPRPNPKTDIKDRSGIIRISLIGIAALFIVLIGIGIVLTMQRIIFADPVEEPVAQVSAETVETVEELPLAPVEDGPEIGAWSQGSSQIEYSIYQGSGLGARGLIYFSLGGSANQDGTNNVKNIFAWAGSEFDFENNSNSSSFGVSEKSTLFLDSREGTLRPELTRLFGTVESSAGCMSVNYRTVEEPLVLSCYSGTCRWRGALNRNFDIPAGQRLSILATSRSDDDVLFEPIYRTEATVFAATLPISPEGEEVSEACVEPYLAEKRQLTVEETTAIASTISGSIANEIGFAMQGNQRSRRIIDLGDTVNIRGLSRISMGNTETENSPDPYELFAYPGSAIHFNPQLEQDQFELGENSVVFLNSTNTMIRPYLAEIFGTAESENGCMSIAYESADQPVVMSCFSGRCQWNGALDSQYRIPVGQRLSIPSNPRSESDVIFEPIYPTESTVLARTLGSIEEGRLISDICVEPFIPDRQVQVIAPNEEEADPTPEPEAEADSEEQAAETEPVETLEPLVTDEDVAADVDEGLSEDSTEETGDG